MAFLIGGANSAADTGFSVANSCRFNPGDTANLSRTKGTSDSTTKGTYSVWFKLSTKAGGVTFFECGTGTADRAVVYISSNETLKLYSKIGNSAVLSMESDAEFRDVSAWSHLVIAIDTADGTAANRVKVYMNGTRITSWSTETYPSQNDALRFFTSSEIEEIGIDVEDDGKFNGYLAEVVKIDNQQLLPTSFGEFDEDSPTIWKPIDVSGLTFGTNGFYLDFEDSGTLGNNAAGGADFTANNLAATDQTTDTPTNNFATLNTSIKSTATFSEGNTRYQAPSSNPVFGSLSTIGTTKGKWYAEVDYNAGSNHYLVLGIGDENFANNGDVGIDYNWDLGKGQATASIAYVVNTGAYRIDNSNTNWGSAGGDGNIIMIAVDQDNEEIYFGVDGTWGNSSDPAAGSNGIDVSSVLTGDTWFIGCTNDTGASETIADFNFGNPSFSISSSNSDANGYGSFEFAVPSGFYALNTKNLAEYG